MNTMFKKSVSKLALDRRGGIAVYFALSFLPVMYLIGAAVDYSRALQVGANLQEAVDAAALNSASLSGAARTDNVSAIVAAAMGSHGYTSANGFTLTGPNATATSSTLQVDATVSVPTKIMKVVVPSISVKRTALVTIGSGSSTSSSSSVTKTTTTTTPAQTACFLTLDLTAALSFGVNSPTSFSVPTCAAYVSTDATATYITGLATYPSTATAGDTVTTNSVDSTKKACILLKATSKQGLTFNSGVTINAPNCEIDVASTANPAVMSNSPSLTLAKLCVAGSNVTMNGTQIPSSILSKNCITNSDPYASSLPSVGTITCDSTKQNLNLSGTVSLSPGTYCYTINFNGSNGTLNLQAGLYIIKNSNWNINNAWTVNGTGVTFYFADSSSYVQFNSGVTSNLSAPTTGTYKDILMFEPTTISSNSNIAIDGGSHKWTGLIYLPSRDVTFNSMNAVSTAADSLTMVFDTLILDSNTNWNFSYDPGKNISTSNVTISSSTTYNYGAWYNSVTGVSFTKVCSHASYNLNVTPNGSDSCSRITDPFSGNLPTVTAAACTSGNTYATGSTAFTPTAAGTFCGFPTFTGTIPAGLYVIATAGGATSSKLTLNNVTGPGVTFYVADTTATIAVTGAAKGITAPTSGLYEGILIFMPSSFTTKQLVTWQNLTNTGYTTSTTPAMSGLIYAPSWEMNLNTWTNGYFAVTLVADAIGLSSMNTVTWAPSARTIYVDNLGTAVASYTTTTTTTTTTVAGTSTYLSK